MSTSLVLLLVGAAAIAAGWFYTGGPKPYGYLGLGEVFVFVFFGLVATAGTTFAAIESVTALSLLMGSAVGALACALLVVNNLRDIPTDREVGKKTLAVRLGDQRTRWFYVGLIGTAFVLSAVARRGVFRCCSDWWRSHWRRPDPIGARGATGAALIPVLGETGKLQLAWGSSSPSGSLSDTHSCDEGRRTWPSQRGVGGDERTARMASLRSSQGGVGGVAMSEPPGWRHLAHRCGEWVGLRRANRPDGVTWLIGAGRPCQSSHEAIASAVASGCSRWTL